MEQVRNEQTIYSAAVYCRLSKDDEQATVIPYAINWEYQYNADGIRIYRSNGATTYRYIYNGDQLSQMEITEEATGQKNLLTFSYDANGLPMTVDYNGATYYFVTNLQGDVIAITNANGQVVAEYAYDAWGNTLSISGSMASTLGKHNPLRYRGYVYDAETNLYYLQSRYYDAEIGRFINADGQFNTDAILDCNMFAYCMNNPANHVDPLGTASYKNSYTVHKDNKGNVLGYNVVTTIKIMLTTLKYKYYIKANGIIQFDFDKNNYWGLLWRGGSKTLAKAMYKQAKAINKNFLYGRTIGGLNTELQGHWAAYQVTGSSRAGVADMGALVKGKTGYDSNAWFWESGNAAKIVARIKFSRIWGHTSIIRDLLRYI